MTPTTFFNKLKERLNHELGLAWLSYKTKYDYNRRKARGGEMKSRPNGDFCDLAVVTFNNAEVVEYQIRTLRKFFTFPYRYTVFDNSTDEEKASEIEQICHKYETGYIRLPQQDFLPTQEYLPMGQASYSHGIACNYLFKNYIQCGGSKYFGLLDHDIFPMAEIDISKYLDKQFFYGYRIYGWFNCPNAYDSHRYGYFIWPGLWFIRMDSVDKRKVNFNPSLRLHGDTGACNGLTIFKGLDWSQYKTAIENHCFFDGVTDIFEGGYSLFDNTWVHCWNASNYMGRNSITQKMQRIYGMLEERLRL